MFLGEVIKQYRDNHSMSMDDFSKKSGLSKGYISMLEKNENPKTKEPIVPSLTTLNKVATAMNMQVDDLFKAIDGRQLVSLVSHGKISHGTRIKVLGSVPAGVPLEAIEDIVDWEDIQTDWTTGGQEYIGLRVKGDSMYPKYIEGDTVILRLQQDCESGQDCVVYVNGYDATLKKVIKKQDCLILQPLNPAYDPRIYEYDDELNPVSILGVIVEIRRKIRE